MNSTETGLLPPADDSLRRDYFYLKMEDSGRNQKNSGARIPTDLQSRTI